MTLDEAQRQKVSEWLRQGLKLSEIQKKLDEEFGISMTYMEVRFLLDDLKLKPKDTEPPAPPKEAGKPAQAAEAEPAEEKAEEPLAPQGGVKVTVDSVTRPGALASGKVAFSDGNTAEWYFDQMGRLGVAPKQQGYKPSQQDIMAFQAELQNELSRLGL